jgi:hypothetical protein
VATLRRLEGRLVASLEMLCQAHGLQAKGRSPDVDTADASLQARLSCYSSQLRSSKLQRLKSSMHEGLATVRLKAAEQECARLRQQRNALALALLAGSAVAMALARR